MPSNNIQARPNVESTLLKKSTLFKNLGNERPLPVTASFVTSNAAMVKSPSEVGTYTDLVLRGQIDQRRIGRFLSTQKGREWVKNQQVLQLSNPKMESGNQLNLNGDFYTNGALEYTRIFNARNTLKQVKEQGQGYHYDRPGQTPITPYQAKYYNIVKQKTTEENRLVVMTNLKVNSTDRYAPMGDNLSTIVKLGLSRRANMLFDYVGGPNSNDLNGFTSIPRFDYTNTWANFTIRNKVSLKYNDQGSALLGLVPKQTSKSTSPGEPVTVRRSAITPGQNLTNPIVPTSYDTQASHSLSHRAYVTGTFLTPQDQSPINKSKTLDYTQLIARQQEFNVNTKIGDDFRIAAGEDAFTQGYEGKSGEGYLAATYGIGNPGSKTIKKVDYSTVGYGTNDEGVDKVNMLDVDQPSGDGTRDLIKCVFTALETQQDVNNLSNVSVPIVFRSYVTNFSDNYSAQYNEHQYVGRGEKFYTYNVADRKISFNLKIAAASRAEMKPLYRKLNYLASQIYPGYSGFDGGTGNGFMRAPLIKVTIGDYLADQPGFMTGLTISIPDDAPWEIAADKAGKDKDMYELPQMLDLTVQFTPIHNFLARRSVKFEKRLSITPFITPNETNNKFNIG